MYGDAIGMWLDPVRATPITEVLRVTSGHVRGRSVPCPVCRAPRRGSSDPRLPAGLTGSGTGWACHACKERGDTVAYLSWLLLDVPPRQLRADGWDRLRSYCVDLGLCDDGSSNVTALMCRPVTPAAPHGALYPPEGELYSVIRSTVPPDRGVVAEWLKYRGIPILPRLPVRGLRDGCHLPEWAHVGRGSWLDRGYRAIVPLYDRCGLLRSIRCRRVIQEKGPKEVAPRGFTTAGLVLASSVGRDLLRGTRDQWNGRVVVVEGVPDWLLWCARDLESTNATRPAIFGVGAGAWTPSHGQAIPTGASVEVRTHHDPDGHRYADGVAATLGHCSVTREQAEP